MKNTLQIPLLVCIIASTSLASAATKVNLGSNAFRIEPIAGYETVYRDTPTPHTSTRVIYGGRLVLGSGFLAGELEYTKGSDTENYSVAPEKVFHEDEKAKLGLRLTHPFNQYFFTSARLGAQASKGYKEETNGAVVTRTEIPIKYLPYAGASLGIHFGSFISISAGTTMVFRDSSDMSKNDVQNTLSVSIGVN